VQNQLNSDELQKHVTEMKQNENNAVYLNLHNLQFEKLATFLATISKEEHLTITRLSLVPVNKKGIVNAEVEMKT
jgi:type II secretory pathway component PulM